MSSCVAAGSNTTLKENSLDLGPLDPPIV